MNEIIVNVGNIGNIECGNIRDAIDTYNEYIIQSDTGIGRAGQEDVFLLIDGEVRREYIGFKVHGSYGVSNSGGYLVELSDCGSMARMKDSYDSNKSKISDWKEIVYMEDEDEQDGELLAVIDPKGYNILLNHVMRI